MFTRLNSSALMPCLDSLDLDEQAPNKRLKLAGAYRSKGSGVLCPWRGTDYRPATLRRLACRPQLKRDPLGSSRANTILKCSSPKDHFETSPTPGWVESSGWGRS